MQHVKPRDHAAAAVPVRLEGRPLLVADSKPHAIGGSASIRAEIADAARFLSLQRQWDDLVLRAAEPNPFLHPIMIAAGVGQASADEASVVLAWQGERLVGVWPFVPGQARSGAPVRVLKTPVHPTMPNGTPVIDAELAEQALSAILDAIKSSAALPKILSVSFCNGDGPVMAALHRACLSRGRAPAMVRRATRPYLACRQDPTAYFAQAMSSSRRRKLGQLRRRLGTRGRVELKVHRDWAGVSEALERFMQLEAAGWKGISGHPFLGTEKGGAFARAVIPPFARHGLAEIWELSLSGQAVSMAIVLRQHGKAFDWKIAYDETHGDCSPGVLLAQDYTTSFLSDGATDFADSCAADDTGLLGTLWTGRQGTVDVLLDARGSSATFLGLRAIETCYAHARRLAKKVILRAPPKLLSITTSLALALRTASS
jgi:CelD/BcsL family acetyltransferase involved in cellulose biosynthesis